MTTNAYPETNVQVIEKALYCLKHGETESVENWLDLLRERLTENSRADALTYRQRRIIDEAAKHLTAWLDTDSCDCDGYGHSCGRPNVVRTRDELLEVLAASPVEQPAAAPIDEPACRACDAGVCSVHGPEQRMAGVKVAPSPADERAATFEWWLESLSLQRRALIGDVRDVRMGWEAARAASHIAPDDGRCYAPACGKWDGNDTCTCARAASANETADERDDEANDYPPTPESERAAFNAMMRWHLIRLLQAWRYGGDMRAAGMAAFEWARANDVGRQAFKASENAAKLSARTASASETGAEGAAIPYGHEFADMDGERHFKRGTLPSYAQSNIVPLYAAPQPAQADARPTDDELWDQTLRERDEYHESADKLAAAIAKHFGVDIGEHSNANCPWDEALEVIEAHAAVLELADDQWIDLASRHANADWNSVDCDGYLASVKMLCEDYRAMLARSPAQADARVGLDEGQREALQEAICWANDDGLPGTAEQLRSILQGANHA